MDALLGVLRHLQGRVRPEHLLLLRQVPVQPFLKHRLCGFDGHRLRRARPRSAIRLPAGHQNTQSTPLR